MPHTEKQTEMLNELDGPLRALGEEVLNPDTSIERLKDITQIGRLYHEMKERQQESLKIGDYSEMTDEELSAALISEDTPPAIKDDIARYVTTRALGEHINARDESE